MMILLGMVASYILYFLLPRYGGGGGIPPQMLAGFLPLTTPLLAYPPQPPRRKRSPLLDAFVLLTLFVVLFFAQVFLSWLTLSPVAEPYKQQLQALSWWAYVFMFVLAVYFVAVLVYTSRHASRHMRVD